jgi:hypothetical protein
LGLALSLAVLPSVACVAIDDETVALSELDGVELDCPRGGSTGPINVDFHCTEIDVVSCKDLSNVVLEYADGSHQKFEGLSGHQGTFAGAGEHEGAEIVGVWVKAGNNASGDGPGYGERFDSPEGICEEELECDGGPIGPIEAEFTCTELVVLDSCKDLSNVVLEYADGAHQKFEGLTGHEGVFAGTGEHADKSVVGAWVKAGDNASGDGPGYGERFDNHEICHADPDDGI